MTSWFDGTAIVVPVGLVSNVVSSGAPVVSGASVVSGPSGDVVSGVVSGVVSPVLVVTGVAVLSRDLVAVTPASTVPHAASSTPATRKGRAARTRTLARIGERLRWRWRLIGVT